MRQNCKFLFLGILFCMTLVGCSKVELPAPDVNPEDPVFTVKGLLNGAPINIAAGVDDYQLTSDYDTLGNGLIEMKGSIEVLDNCSPICQPALNFTINSSDDYLTGGSFDVDESLYEGLYNYQYGGTAPVGYGDSAMVVILETYSVWLTDPHSIEWSLDDGVFQPFNSPLLFLTEDQVQTNQNIVFRIMVGGTEVLRHEQALTPNDNHYCDFDLFPTALGPHDFDLQFYDYGQYHFVNWNDELSGYIHQHQIQLDPLEDLHHYFVRSVIDNVCTSQINMVFKKNNDGWFEPAYLKDAFIQYLGPQNYPQFGAVSIEYIDEQGKVFNSSAEFQSGFFEILNVDSFQDNSAGQKTKKVQFRADELTLISQDGEVIEITDFEGVFGVAHP